MKNSTIYLMVSFGFNLAALFLIESRMSPVSIPFSLFGIVLTIFAYMEHRNDN